MEQLGVQPQALLLQVINFTILFVVLSKLLYGPITKMLEKRTREIEEGIALTRKMKEEEEKLAVKREKLLDEGRNEAHKMLADSKAQAKEEEKVILAVAHKEAQDVIQKAKTEAERVHAGLSDAIRVEATALAADMVKRMLSGALTEDQQHKIIAKQLKEISKSH